MQPGMHGKNRGAAGKKIENSLDDTEFSTLSTGFSTGRFRAEKTGDVYILVDITLFDSLRRFRNFFGVSKNVKQTKRAGKNST